MLFPKSPLKIPISSLAGHSLVMRHPRWKFADANGGCHAIFTTDPSGYSPEAFSRIGVGDADGDIYLAGLNDADLPLPEKASDARVGPEIELLKTTARRLFCRPEEELDVIREGLCFRPVGTSGRPPVVCQVDSTKLGSGIGTRNAGEGGVFLAVGHGPWGITQSLGTRKIMSELIEGDRPSASIRLLKL